VVEGFLLPELAGLPGGPIDLTSCVSQPGGTLVFQAALGAELDQQMNMVRHDDKVAQAVSVPIEMPQRVDHEPGQRELPQAASSVALVEALDSARDGSSDQRLDGRTQAGPFLGEAKASSGKFRLATRLGQ
jgi:hypothetical protein